VADKHRKSETLVEPMFEEDLGIRHPDLLQLPAFKFVWSRNMHVFEAIEAMHEAQVTRNHSNKKV